LPSIQGRVIGSTGTIPDSPSIAFSQAEGPLRLLACCPDALAAVWDLDAERPAFRFQETTGKKIRCRSVAFSPSGKRVAIGFTGNQDETTAGVPSVQVFEVVSGNRLAAFVGHGEPPPLDSFPWPATVYCVSFLGEDRVLSAGRDCTVRLWDIARKELIGMFVDPTDPTKRSHALDVNAVAPWRDGKVVSAGDDGTLRVWKVEGLERVFAHGQPAEPHRVCFQTIAFLPDGESALVGTNEGEIYRWKVGTDQCDRWVRKHDAWRIESLVVLPGGEYVISGCRDKTIKLWKVSDGTCLDSRSFKEGLGVASVALAPDGRTLAVSISLGEGKGKVDWFSLEPTR
jgi:WD40 repeat protein